MLRAEELFYDVRMDAAAEMALHVGRDVSLADRVFEWLAEQMLTESIKPGQWLSENELAAQLGVSRVPIREALKMLAHDGLVTALPRRGTLVAEYGPQGVFDLYEARKIISDQTIRLAVPNLRDSDVESLAKAVEMISCARDPRDVYRAGERVLGPSVPRCGNRVLAELDALLRRRCILLRGTIVRLERHHAGYLQSRERLLAGCRRRDADAAAAAVVDFLGETQQQVIAAIRSGEAERSENGTSRGGRRPR